MLTVSPQESVCQPTRLIVGVIGIHSYRLTKCIEILLELV